MRKIRTAMIFLILFLLLGGCLAQFFYIRSAAELLLPLAEQLCRDVLIEQWDHAQNSLDQLRSLWRDRRVPLYSMVKHSCIDAISAELAAITADLAAENYAQLPAEAARLREQLQSLARTEQFRLSNIL